MAAQKRITSTPSLAIFVLLLICAACALVGCSSSSDSSTTIVTDTDSEPAEESAATVPTGSAQTAFEDMALIYIVSGTPSTTGAQPSGEMLRAPGANAGADAKLIYDIIYPSIYPDRANLSWNTPSYGLDYAIPNSGPYEISLDVGQTILSSFYGSCPSDVRSITMNGASYNGDGWTIMQADGGLSRSISTSSWVAAGSTVTCDAQVTYIDGISNPVTYTYRVSGTPDAASIFGYHLTSVVYLSSTAGTSGTSSSTNTAAPAEPTLDPATYMFDQLAAAGLTPAGTGAIVDSRTDEEIIIHVYEDHPDHIATIGWYRMDLATWDIYDYITGDLIIPAS